MALDFNLLRAMGVEIKDYLVSGRLVNYPVKTIAMLKKMLNKNTSLKTKQDWMLQWIMLMKKTSVVS
jgi:hypothetical protein